MDWGRLREALRFDGAGWRRFAELGCVYGPEWWKRASPPVIAAVIYGLARAQRAAVVRNQQQVRGRGSALRARVDGYRVFASFARSLTETMEQWGPRPRPLDVRTVDGDIFRGAIAEGRGLVVLTGHFGCWEVAARLLTSFARPVNMVVAHEPNASVHDFMHDFRTRHGFQVIYSDRSVFAGLPIVQALRRDEVVGMQIEPWGALQGSHEVTFFGRPTRFQLGPFAIARVARAPLVAVFAIRTGIRRYELRTVARFDPRTPADCTAGLEWVVRAYENVVRERPEQWLMFEDVWGSSGRAAAAAAPPAVAPLADAVSRPGRAPR